MIGFLIALASPFLYAVTNYLDKVMLEKYFKNTGVGTIMIFSGVLSVVALPFLFIIDPTVFNVPLIHIAALSAVGILNALVLFFYLKALEDEEVSIAIIFYQLVPVIAYVLGYFVLGETLTTQQLLAMLVIIFGTSIVILEVDAENRFRMRKRTAYYMLGASACWAVGAVIFKAVAFEESVVRGLFWEHFMLTVIGIALFVCIDTYRKNFLDALRENSKPILAFNITNELIYISANIVMAFAYLLAPIAMILLANSYQALFALLIGAFLTIFFPKIAAEKIHVTHIWQKVFAIGITAVGTYLLLA